MAYAFLLGRSSATSSSTVAIAIAIAVTVSIDVPLGRRSRSVLLLKPHLLLLRHRVLLP